MLDSVTISEYTPTMIRKEQRRNHRVAINLTGRDYNRLDKLAKEEGISKAELMRLILREWLVDNH